MSEKTNPAKRAQQLRRLSPVKADQPVAKAPRPLLKSRVNSVTAACSSCRKQKSKCSGERPACQSCVRQRIRCQYTTKPGETESQAVNRKHQSLVARVTLLEEVFELLKNLPGQDAQDVLQRIRSKSDLETILNHIKTGDLLLQLAVVPETRFRYDFPYRSEMPEDYVPDNPYLDSLIYEVTSLYSSDGSSGRLDRRSNGNAANVRLEEEQSLYLRPFHAAEVFDPLLSDAKLSSWTTVCDDDVLMRNLLGTFLSCEYAFTAAFQKDLFLEDMADQQQDFCSSLLVNIILGYSCVCYSRFLNRAEYWNPHTLLYRFVAEAKRLWELEANEPRITTIQAGILFSVFHNLCGLDEIGQAYRLQAITMARQLRIFTSAIHGDSERMCKGIAFAAWTLYNWETLTGFSFMFPPLLRDPPDWPLPDPSEGAQWYGEVWIKYPLSHHLTPSNFGQVFKARSDLRVIMNQFCHAAYATGSEITIDTAYKLFSQLQAWFDGLSSPLLPRAVALPGHLQVHMYFHHLILTIYEPLRGKSTTREPSPHQIVANARKNLQTLVRLYYLRHGFEAMDLFLVIPLMQAGSDCIDTINESTSLPKLESLRSTLILVAKGLYDQRRNHYLARALFRVIRGRMRPSEAALLRGTIKINEDEEVEEKREMARVPVRSHWPVSVVKRKEDLDTHILTNLVVSYGHLNMADNRSSSEEVQKV